MYSKILGWWFILLILTWLGDVLTTDCRMDGKLYYIRFVKFLLNFVSRAIYNCELLTHFKNFRSPALFLLVSNVLCFTLEGVSCFNLNSVICSRFFLLLFWTLCFCLWRFCWIHHWPKSWFNSIIMLYMCTTFSIKLFWSDVWVPNDNRRCAD